MGAPPNPRRGTRDPRPGLALFYAAHFGHMGIVLPFLPLWLLSLGLDSAAIGLLVALSPLSKMVAPWTWGRLADRSGRRRGLLIVASLAAARGFAYGRVGLWGSLTFVAVAAASGALIGRVPDPAGLHVASGMLVLAALAATGFPPPATGRANPVGSRSEGLRRSLRDRSLWRLLIACALMQAGHGPYYAFYSIRLENLGYGGTAIGLFWALAVVCEVALLARIDRGIDRFGTRVVLRVSLLAASVRWLTIAITADPVWLAAAQTLHAMSYAAFHVAALREIHRRFNPEDRATGQALYSGLTYGLGIFTGTLVAGVLAERVGLSALFGISAATAVAAIVLLGRE